MTIISDFYMGKVFSASASLVAYKNHPRIFNSFLLFLLSLFDFYRDGFRIFELTAYSLFFLGILYTPTRFRVSHLYYGPLILFSLIYSSIGFIYLNNPKTALGVLIATVVYSLLRIRSVIIPQKHLRIIIIFHLLAFFAQIIYYYSFGDIINYHKFTDVEARLESSIFRAAGFFYEPAIYCLAVYMLTVLINPLDSRFNFIEILAAISMVLSFSILGVASAFLILLRLASVKRFLLLYIVLVMFLIAQISLTVDDPLVAFFVNRLTNIDSDASADGRYGGIDQFFQMDNVFHTLFGAGFGSSFEQYGSNAVSAMLSSIGVFGLVVFLALILFIAPNPILFFFLFTPILVAAPIFTYGFFAIWLSQVPHMYRIVLMSPRKGENI